MWSYKSIQVPCNIASIFCSGHLLRTEWKYCHGFFSILLDITIKGHWIYKTWLLYKFIYNLQELQILYIIPPIDGFFCTGIKTMPASTEYRVSQKKVRLASHISIQFCTWCSCCILSLLKIQFMLNLIICPVTFNWRKNRLEILTKIVLFKACRMWAFWGK